MSKMQLPPEIVMQRQMEAAKVNNKYNAAFQIFNTLLSYAITNDIEGAAKLSIQYAEIFQNEVEKDVKLHREASDQR